MFCQVLDKNKDIDAFLKDVVSRDDIYQNDIEVRLKYINDFDKKILINFQNLPNEFIKKQNRQNLEIIKQIHDLYYENVSKMEKEFNINQKFKYKQLTPKARINNLLLIDELRNFPDTYSVLFNNELVKLNYENFDKKIKTIFNLSKNYGVDVLKLQLEVNDYKKQFLNKPIYYPSWEKPEIISYYSFVDIAIWCYSNSSLNEPLSK